MDGAELRRLLAPILAALPPGSVWRPVRDRNGHLLAPGSGALDDILPETLDAVDFAGKTAVDLGCNLGHYSFLAARRGAAGVLGVDIDPLAVAACRLLATHHGLDNVDFLAADFLKETAWAQGRRCDVALLVDFIGRGVVAKGRVAACLHALARLTDQELLLTFRPVYPLAELNTTREELLAHYPGDFVTDRDFLLLDYAAHTLGPRWRLTPRPTTRSAALHLKTPVHGVRA